MDKTLPDREMNEFDQLREWIKSSKCFPRSTQIHNLGNGVLFCRLMSKIFPGSLANIVIYNRPAHDGQFMHNYMLLQAAFAKVNIPWNFDTRKLIACDNQELLRLAQTLSHFHDAYNEQQQRKLQSRPNNNTHRSNRCVAGDIEMSEVPAETSHISANTIDVQFEALQKSFEQLVINPEPMQTTVGSVEMQLNEQIQTLFNNQQLAVAAFMADQQNETCATTRVATVMCMCSNCLRKRSYMANQ